MMIVYVVNSKHPTTPKSDRKSQKNYPQVFYPPPLQSFLKQQ